MFNNTSTVLSHSSGQMTGVILPYSEKVLSSQDIDNRIEKAKGYLEYLTARLSHRNIHGGKALLQKAKTLTSDRLTMLQMAKTLISELQTVEPPRRKRTTQETTMAISAFANRIFSSQMFRTLATGTGAP